MTDQINQTKKHTVSVVIPTIGRFSLQQVLAGLDTQTRKADEVIVINDTERNGTSWARNEGIKKATGTYIAFLDDDNVPPPEWIETLLEAIETFQADGAGGSYLETDPLLNQIRSRMHYPTEPVIDTTGLVGIGGNIIYKRKWLDKLLEEDGFIFNDNFSIYGYEDMEVAWRLRRKGAKLVFVPCHTIHIREAPLKLYFKVQFNRGRGVYTLFQKHKSNNAHITALPSKIYGKKKKWFSSFFKNIVGPFDIQSFKPKRYFFIYWFGEKVKAAGFLWESLQSKIKKIR